MDINNRYCQSCGMPLDIEKKEYLGTNVDNSKNDEFCFSCYAKGKFTFEHPVDKLIDDWVEALDWYNNYAETNYSSNEFRTILKKRLPVLKRWQQKKQTWNINYEIINRITTYINQHLFDDLNNKYLAQLANLSEYHFIRIFKSIINESPGAYIQRLRLEYIAYLLVTTELSLQQITDRVNYQSRHSISKAFKKHFGIYPSVYKKRYNKIYIEQSNIDNNIDSNYSIEWIKDMYILFLALDKNSNDIKNYTNKWESLINYVESHGIMGSYNKYLSISLDDPLITNIYNCRFFLGIIVDKNIKPNGQFGVMKIPDGKYIKFSYKGDYSGLHELYRNIYLKWLPETGFRQKSTLSFEIYINTPNKTSVDKLVTEIYIPVEGQKNKNENFK